MRVLALFAALLFSALSHAAPTLVDMKTSAGTLVLELDGDKAPKTVENFVKYANAGFYNGTIFHRVIDGFMIQGGGFTAAMAEKPTRPPIANEAKNGLRNTAGAIAMARTSDPQSATAQFFIDLVDNPRLDFPSFDGWGYAVFGRVVEGMDVVSAIGKTATGSKGMHQNVPITPIIIESVKVRSTAGEAKKP